jgi:hypothetical protein
MNKWERLKIFLENMIMAAEANRNAYRSDPKLMGDMSYIACNSMACYELILHRMKTLEIKKGEDDE